MLLITCGCGSKDAGDRIRPDIRGTITGIIPANDGMREHAVVAFLRIESRKETDLPHDRADVTITDTTLIYRKKGSDLSAVGVEHLKEGQLVEVNFTGPVLESYPVQATARRVVVGN